ncbi:MAG: ABC transporter substrate-binding protein [Alcaligenaceae bacterium]|jgi:branched-chain amino acid transport system substrate-binding protein|nr:ABC transporter substrate-binding protein [Alcaligenaceae bacterium]
MKKIFLSTLLALALPSAAIAEVVVGVTISNTGPAAAIGIQSQNAVQLWPETLGGEPARYVILDDATDVSKAVRNVRKMTSEDKIDLLVGPNITAAALAILDVLKETKTPMISLVGSGSVVQPIGEGGREWAYKMSQNDDLMARAVVEDMINRGYKKVAYIGFADAYGDSWWREFSEAAESKLEIVARESYQRTDNSTMGQVLKLMSANPDAILVAGSGTPAVLPQQTLHERGYQGQIYQTHGIATPEFIQVGGSVVEGTLFPTGPSVVARTLPDDHPVKTAALEFAETYEASYGEGTATQFSSDAWGAWVLADSAVERTLAEGHKPGTSEFREALRVQLESTKDLIVPTGVLNVTAQDHQGFDERAVVMGRVKDGRFVYAAD